MSGIFFRCEHDIGGLDYRIALFAFGKLQLLYRFHGDICFDGVVVAAADSHNGVDGAFFDLFDGPSIWLRAEIFVMSSFVFE